MKFGAIDIGTNAGRLLIGQIINGENGPYLNKISYTRVPLQLGKDVFEHNIITDKKKKKLLQSIKVFKILIDIHEIDEISAVATSAMREAENSSSIIQKIKRKTGIDLKIISGKEEAKTILKAFELLEFNKQDPFIVIDVGGGSTEINIYEDGNNKSSKSFKIGTLRLLNKKVKQSHWKELEQWMDDNISSSRIYKIFGTGGNINKIHKILEGKKMQAINKEQIIQLRDLLLPIDNYKRMHDFGIKPDRIDIIIPAMDIFLYILNKLDADSIIVPKIGLSDGLIYKMYLSNTTTN